MSRVLLLAAAVLLAIGPLPLRAGAASCPSYFYKSDLSRCNADGFCGWFDLRANRLHDGVLEEDDPPPEAATLPGPWAASRNATVGSADWFAIVDSDFDADQSRVAASGDVRIEAPFAIPTFTAYGQMLSLAVTRVTDLVVSGPTAEVDTSLRLVFDGALSEVADNIVEESLHSGMTAQTTVYLGGGICRGASEYVDFLGYHLRTLRDDGVGADTLVANDFFLLDQVSLEGQTELVVGPFTVPTGEALQLEFWVSTTLTTAGNGGYARAAADFSLALGPIGGGPVFDLPPGYSASSPTAGIVANQVPEPASGLVGALAVGLLGWRARRRHSRRGRCPSHPGRRPRGRALVLATGLLLHASSVAAQGFLRDLVVVQDTFLWDGASTFLGNARCPGGTKLLGGGARAVTQGLGLTRLRPSDSQSFGAGARPFAAIGATRELEVTAVCGRVASHSMVEDFTARDSTSPKVLSVNCPPGTSVLGGGASAFGNDEALVGITSSAPSGNGWFGRAYEVDATDLDWELVVVAVCGTVPDRVVVEGLSSPTSLNAKTVTATCPADRVPISGGAFVAFDGREVLSGLHPTDEDTWSSSAFEPFVHLENWSLRTSVICAPEPHAAALAMGAIATLVAVRRRPAPRPEAPRSLARKDRTGRSTPC